MSKEFLNPSIFESEKVKDFKYILKDLYEKVSEAIMSIFRMKVLSLQCQTFFFPKPFLYF